MDSVLLRAFEDELTKIAGTGMSRSLAIPKSPHNLASAAVGTGRAKAGMSKFFKKIAAYGPKHILAAGAAGAGLALIGERKGKKAFDDYRTGRMMRRQQQGG